METAHVQYRAFSHELPLEELSRGRRVIPLKIASVFALLSCAVLAANAGGTAEGMPFVPIYGMNGFFIL